VGSEYLDDVLHLKLNAELHWSASEFPAAASALKAKLIGALVSSSNELSRMLEAQKAKITVHFFDPDTTNLATIA